ncbi:MAG: ABC transporter substrate-binding protein [Bacillota bacterium]
MRRRVFSSMLIILLLSVLLIFTSGVSAQKNIVSMSLNQEISTIDPSKTTDWTESMVIVNLYDTLVTPNPDGTMAPLIAEDWEFSDDGLEYKFFLNEGIKFHDNSELTAEDVKFSFDRMLELKQGYSWLWLDVVEDVKVIDDYTIEVVLNEPYSPFISTLPWLAILNKNQVLENEVDGDMGQDWLLENDAGSGAYKFKSWERGNQIIFEKFEDYFLGFEDNSVDEVRARVIYSDSTVLSEMRTGDLTIADHYRAMETYDRLNNLDDVKIQTAQSGEIFYLKINTKKTPVDNIHVRKALSWAFDYETFNTKIEVDTEQSRGPVPKIIAGHNPDVFQYEKNLDKAREELEKSGYEPGELTITFCYVEGFEMQRKLGLMYQSDLAKVGINLELRPETWGRITDLASTEESTPHITAIFSAANYPDPDNYLYTAYHSSASGTWMSMEWLQNEEIDKMIMEARKTLEAEERNEIYYEIQDKIVDLAPDIFIYSLLKRYGMQENLKGFEFVPVMSFEYDFHKMYFE